MPGNPDFPGTGPVGIRRSVSQSKGNLIMSKGDKTRGNKEQKKPKQEKPKVLATANTLGGKAPITVAGKKVK